MIKVKVIKYTQPKTLKLIKRLLRHLNNNPTKTYLNNEKHAKTT